jgi:hypothetical protein
LPLPAEVSLSKFPEAKCRIFSFLVREFASTAVKVLREILFLVRNPVLVAALFGM